MKPVVTLTLNPAVDASSAAETVHPVRKVRTTNERFDPGGGGINAARVIEELGGRAFAVYLAGGNSGNVLDDLLDELGLVYHRVHVKEPTRVSHVVFERSSGHEYRFTPTGPTLDEREWRSALEFLDLLDFDFLLASGSLSPGVPEDFYVRLERLAAGKGAKLVADTSGEPLRRLLEHGAHLVKPSVGELESVVGESLREPDKLEAAAKSLIEHGRLDMMTVTLGCDGALLVTPDFTRRLPSPNVEVKSAVGSGDSFLASMTLGLARGAGPLHAFLDGIAAGAATAMTVGTELCHRDDIRRLRRELDTMV